MLDRGRTECTVTSFVKSNAKAKWIAEGSGSDWGARGATLCVANVAERAIIIEPRNEFDNLAQDLSQ
jgi:hypothetical protein